jgi:hypothetical protein
MPELIVLVLYRQRPRRVPCQRKGASAMTIPRDTLKTIKHTMLTLKARGEPLWFHYVTYDPIALEALGLNADCFEDYYKSRPAALAEFQRGLRQLYVEVAASLTVEERSSIKEVNGSMGSANVDYLWGDVLG